MAEPNPAPPSKAILFPGDIEVILKLLPRAQIVVGDIPQIYGTLQRLEYAQGRKVALVEQDKTPDVGPEA